MMSSDKELESDSTQSSDTEEELSQTQSSVAEEELPPTQSPDTEEEIMSRTQSPDTEEEIMSRTQSPDTEEELPPTQSSVAEDELSPTQSSDTEEELPPTQSSVAEEELSPTIEATTKSPLIETIEEVGTTKAAAVVVVAPTSKLDSLPRERLLELFKKQAFASKEAKKQAEEYQERIKSLEEKCKSFEEKFSNEVGNEMVSLELDDYKKSCSELTKQLKDRKEREKEKDELVRDMSAKIDTSMQEKEEALQQLKETKVLAAKLNKVIDEQQTTISESSKEVESLTLQSQQMRAECDLEIAKLKKVYVVDKTSEVLRLKSELESLQQCYDNLKDEHRTFKEQAECDLKQTVEQATEDKNILTESFNHQKARLEEKNRELMQKLDEYRNLPSSQPLSSTPHRPINLSRESLSVTTSPISNGPPTPNLPGLDLYNDAEISRLLHPGINDVSDDLITVGLGTRRGSAIDDFVSRPSIHANEEYEALQKELSDTRELLNDMEDTNSKLADQIKILKDEIRRLERNFAREQHTSKNSEYLKNVVMKFLSPPKVNDERQQLLPVLITMLRLTPDEVTTINDYIKRIDFFASLGIGTDQAKQSSVSSTEVNPGGWTSYLWSNIQ